MSNQGSILLDISGTELNSEDKELLRHPVCAGVILFSRNFSEPQQLKNLTREIQQIFPRAILAVDQEGGRVQRFKDGFTRLPPFSHWGKCYSQNQKLCLDELAQMVHTMAKELLAVGINFNLTPVLDLNYGISEVIGERSLHRDPQLVAELGSQIVNHLHKSGLPAVGKHFPGHGAVVVDSHHDLPVDTREWETIWQNDMYPFIQLASQLDAIMPAHIIFKEMDPNPVTFSPFWLQTILRQKLNFQGVIISDDLSMEAAAKFGDYPTRALQALQAGCDLLLICNNRKGAVEALEKLENSPREKSSARIEILKLKFYGKPR